MTVFLFKLLLKCRNVSDVRFRYLRLSCLFKLFLFLSLPILLISKDLILNFSELSLDEILAFVVVQGGHAAQIEKRKFSKGLGVCD
jgi:hypothetical protein